MNTNKEAANSGQGGAISSSDHAALNAAFAERLVGLRWHEPTHEEVKSGSYYIYCPDFTHSADAVLPWLMKHGMWDAEQFLPLDMCRKGCAFQVRLKNVPGKMIVGDADAFPHAAVIALLRAHGVAVCDSSICDGSGCDSSYSPNGSNQEASQ